jgi:hypothetical protein
MEPINKLKAYLSQELPYYIAIIGGRRDQDDCSQIFTIDFEKNAIPDLCNDINKDLIAELKDGYQKFDRVIFESVHINTFNRIAFQNATYLLKDNGIISCNAFPMFNFVNEKCFEDYEYEAVDPGISGMVAFKLDEEDKEAQFNLMKRNSSGIAGERQSKEVWDFVIVDKNGTSIPTIVNDSKCGRTIKSTVSTDSEGLNNSADYDILPTTIDYNQESFISTLTEYLQLDSRFRLEFGLYLKEERTWILKRYLPVFGLFIKPRLNLK